MKEPIKKAPIKKAPVNMPYSNNNFIAYAAYQQGMHNSDPTWRNKHK